LEYPIFDVPLLGGSLLIAGVAVFHAFIAHFSVGAGFFVALAERRAIREGDEATLAFLKKYALLILLVPYVLGTVTGAGIWFTVALVSPRAISVLIHQFVWDWATEWVLFLVEVVSIFLYFFTWGRVRQEVHNRIGWVFAITSLATLVIINAILSFMLTPGGWVPHAPGAVWKAILNPSYFPTTLIRALAAFALAGAGAVALAAFVKGADDRVRERVVSLAYRMILPAILIFPLLGWGFAVLPERAQQVMMGAGPVMLIFGGFGAASLGILWLAAALGAWRRDYTVSSVQALATVLVAFVAYGAFEFVREGLRRPYIIEGFMYSTGVTTEAAAKLDRRGNIAQTRVEGVVAFCPWALPPGKAYAALDPLGKGEAVYRAACLRCHSVDGYNAVRPLVRSWSRETIRHLLDRMHEVKLSMPPFPGTDAEKEALADYLVSLRKPPAGSKPAGD